MQTLNLEDSVLFDSLWPSTADKWIDKEFKKRGWNPKTVKHAEFSKATHQRGRSGNLEQYPETVQWIITRLQVLRIAGLQVSVHVTRAIRLTPIN